MSIASDMVATAMLARAVPSLSLPSPDQGVWYLGPFPIRAYALCIITGIAAAIWLGRRRWAARGGVPDDIGDLALWAVPLGILGGRLYHLATNPELYFADGRNPWNALYIWQGALGIWGAIRLAGSACTSRAAEGVSRSATSPTL